MWDKGCAPFSVRLSRGNPPRDLRKCLPPPRLMRMMRHLPIGLIWLILFYVTNGSLPISALGNWNLVVGFAFIVAGFGISTQWR